MYYLKVFNKSRVQQDPWHEALATGDADEAFQSSSSARGHFELIFCSQSFCVQSACATPFFGFRVWQPYRGVACPTKTNISGDGCGNLAGLTKFWGPRTTYMWTMLCQNIRLIILISWIRLWHIFLQNAVWSGSNVFTWQGNRGCKLNAKKYCKNAGVLVFRNNFGKCCRNPCVTKEINEVEKTGRICFFNRWDGLHRGPLQRHMPVQHTPERTWTSRIRYIFWSHCLLKCRFWHLRSKTVWWLCGCEGGFKMFHGWSRWIDTWFGANAL